MKSFPELRFRGSVWLFCVSLILCPPSAHAHDPGLSSATVTVGGDQIDVILGFAKKDAQSLVIADGNRVQVESAQGFAVIKPQLEAVAARAVELRLDDVVAAPDQAIAKLKDDQNIDILLIFRRTGAARLSLLSTLFERLPYGHREFVSVQLVDGTTLGEAMLSGKENSIQTDLPVSRTPAASENHSHSFFTFLSLGVEHILTGYDHLLFLFALLVVCRDLRSIATVITCFTVAHSITLGLAALDIVKLSPRVVEPMIAASIAYVGIENLFRGDSPKWRWLITFSFGLVHGLGFADALKEFGIGSGQFGIVLPLVGFNLGVEIGQLSVAAIVLPILRQLRRRPVFMSRLVQVCSALVALAGAYWTVERIWQS
jgi:hydrogenase/urease accessory protein HupE